MFLDLHTFEPSFLIATPQLQDPHFHQTVVLLVEYNAQGAFGLIINRPLNVTLAAVQSKKVAIAPEYLESPIWYGGPVGPNDVLCLYHVEHTHVPGDTGVTEEIAVAPAESLILQSATRPPQPDTFRVMAGHAGWGAKQLDEEISGGAWLVAPITTDLVFFDRPDRAWQTALQRLGVNPAQYHNAPTSTMN